MVYSPLANIWSRGKRFIYLFLNFLNFFFYIVIFISYDFWTGSFQDDSHIESSLIISHNVTSY